MKVVRGPWQRFYGWAHGRRRRYRAARAESLGRPTVSVGNLHWGGSGKTPTVVAAARSLNDAGPSGPDLRVAVLSRGYRRRGSAPLVVSLGEGPLVTVEKAGDEPLMIAEQAPGVAVVVGADRRQPPLWRSAAIRPSMSSSSTTASPMSGCAAMSRS